MFILVCSEFFHLVSLKQKQEKLNFLCFCSSSSEEVLHILGKILVCLQRGRTCLVVPRKKNLEEMIKSGNMVGINNDFFPLLFPPLKVDNVFLFENL